MGKLEFDECCPSQNWTYRDEDMGGTVAAISRRRGGEPCLPFGVCLFFSPCFILIWFDTTWSVTSEENTVASTSRNPPAPKVLGRDLPDGTRKRLQVYLGGGPIFRPKPPVFDRSWRSPSKNTVKNSTEDTCSWTRPSKIGKRKVKKTRVFQLFDLNFLVCNIFFCGSAGWPGPEADFWVFGPVFGLIFRRFVIAETLVFTVFFCFLHAWRLASKLPKTS